MAPNLDPLAASILAFWFGPVGSPERSGERDVWFRKDEAFDAEIRDALRRRHRHRAGRRLRRLVRDGRRRARPRAAARPIHAQRPSRHAAAFAGDARALATARRCRRARARSRTLSLRPLVPVHAVRARRGRATCSGARSNSSARLRRKPATRGAARVGAQARRRHRALRPVSAPQRDSRPRVDAGGSRFPDAARVALLSRITRMEFIELVLAHAAGRGARRRAGALVARPAAVAARRRAASRCPSCRASSACTSSRRSSSCCSFRRCCSPTAGSSPSATAGRAASGVAAGVRPRDAHGRRRGLPRSTG